MFSFLGLVWVTKTRDGVAAGFIEYGVILINTGKSYFVEEVGEMGWTGQAYAYHVSIKI